MGVRKSPYGPAGSRSTNPAHAAGTICSMTVRERAHKLIDELPDERVEDAQDHDYGSVGASPGPADVLAFGVARRLPGGVHAARC